MVGLGEWRRWWRLDDGSVRRIYDENLNYR